MGDPSIRDHAPPPPSSASSVSSRRSSAGSGSSKGSAASSEASSRGSSDDEQLGGSDTDDDDDDDDDGDDDGLPRLVCVPHGGGPEATLASLRAALDAAFGVPPPAQRLVRMSATGPELLAPPEGLSDSACPLSEWSLGGKSELWLEHACPTDDAPSRLFAKREAQQHRIEVSRCSDRAFTEALVRRIALPPLMRPPSTDAPSLH